MMTSFKQFAKTLIGQCFYLPRLILFLIGAAASGQESSESGNWGYAGALDVYYSVAQEGGVSNALGLNLITGYGNGIAAVGLGIGFRSLDDTHVPIFADFRVNFGEEGLVPFLNAGAGNSFNAGDGFSSNGLYIFGRLGVAQRVGDEKRLAFTVGYESEQGPAFRETSGFLVPDGKDSYGFLSFALSLSF